MNECFIVHMQVAPQRNRTECVITKHHSVEEMLQLDYSSNLSRIYEMMTL